MDDNNPTPKWKSVGEIDKAVLLIYFCSHRVENKT